MSEESDPLSKLAESVADGEPIDWDALGGLAADPHLRALFDHLRIVAGVADVHRSQVDEDTPRPGPDADSSLPVRYAATERWGHLALIRKIGEGAFGEVYLAHDTWLDHPRALKLLKPEVASRVAPSQLLHEARKLVRVRHPNVVTVHGADRHDGRVGFWMDFIDGHTLAERLADGRLSVGEAAYIGQELCQALAAVHLQNLIHRDVKAQNVMRATDDGRIILMDFGAGEIAGAQMATRPQGTPLYLAPELFAGRPATTLSDIYALGVLLYYLVTSDFPVGGTTVDELEAAHRAGHRRPLRAVRPDLPAWFVAAVERALASDPAQRFATAAEMHEALGPPQPATDFRTAQDRSTAAVRTSARPVVARVSLLLTIGAAIIEVVGFLAGRTFELALHVEPAFAGTPVDYFRVGLQGVLPFVIYWLAGAAVLGLLHGLDVVSGTPVASRCRRWLTTVHSVTAMRVSAFVCLAGAAAWAHLLYWHWGLFGTLIDLQAGTTDMPGGIGLTPALAALHVGYSGWAAWLTFGLIVATVQVFPALAQRCTDPAALRPFRWATLLLIVLMASSAVAPRRIVLEEYPPVLFGNRASFVIASRAGELVVYDPRRPSMGAVRVPRSDPALVFVQKTPRRLVDSH